MNLSINEYKYPPLEHQPAAIQHILSRPFSAVLDEPGVGKTYQTIHAVCEEYKLGLIDTVVVVAPASGRGVWDREGGEIERYAFVPYGVIRFDNQWQPGKWKIKPQELQKPYLLFIVVSYSFLRARVVTKTPKGAGKGNTWLHTIYNEDTFIRKLGDRKIHLVLDESSYVKSHNAAQTKACMKVRKFATRCTILNGTPIGNNILDLWSQFHILDPESIFNLEYYHFRGRYCVLGGWENKQVISYEQALATGTAAQKEKAVEAMSKLDALKEHMKPWIIRREKDILKLPPKMYSVKEVTLSPKEWTHYQEMKHDLVSYLDTMVTIAQHGGVKLTRLSQITSGILGGLESEENYEREVKIVGESKLNALQEWYENEHDGSPFITWCRFRPEIEQVVARFRKMGKRSEYIASGQSDIERQEIINGFQNGDIDNLVVQPQSGGMALTLHRANTAVYLSNLYSHLLRTQSEDRIHRKGQEKSCLYIDFIAVGPKGEKTIDEKVVKTLLEKKSLADWTVADWKEAVK